MQALKKTQINVAEKSGFQGKVRRNIYAKKEPTELNKVMRKQAENAFVAFIRHKQASAIWGDMQHEIER